MSQRPKTSLFLLGIISACVLWLSVSSWLKSNTSLKEARATESATEEVRQSSFRYAVQDNKDTSSTPSDSTVDLSVVRKQLSRRNQMEKSGMVHDVIENENMPEEIRRRFRNEKMRLDALAKEYPELAAKADAVPVSQNIDANGELDPKLKEALVQMKSSGAWDELHDTYLRQLEQAAADETLPADQRPTKEQLDAARKDMVIPTL
ncbi:hypothetical protein P3T73_11745 [Kiritimatiellota bacterium B12222]|nr:hypothetical protein P3T73_11745 [Kiritimatiellota bacterium B12222]